jgi:hypothetical protein
MEYVRPFQLRLLVPVTERAFAAAFVRRGERGGCAVRGANAALSKARERTDIRSAAASRQQACHPDNLTGAGFVALAARVNVQYEFVSFQAPCTC